MAMLVLGSSNGGQAWPGRGEWKERAAFACFTYCSTNVAAATRKSASLPEVLAHLPSLGCRSQLVGLYTILNRKSIKGGGGTTIMRSGSCEACTTQCIILFASSSFFFLIFLFFSASSRVVA